MSYNDIILKEIKNLWNEFFNGWGIFDIIIRNMS